MNTEIIELLEDTNAIDVFVPLEGGIKTSEIIKFIKSNRRLPVSNGTIYFDSETAEIIDNQKILEINSEGKYFEFMALMEKAVEIRRQSKTA